MKKKKRTKYWYLQDWGTYTTQTPVFVGYTPAEICATLKRQKDFNKEAVAEFCEDIDETEKVFKTVQGGIWFTKTGFSIMYLPKYEGSWSDIETLVHECFHLVINQLGKSKMLINHSTQTVEEEALAYQQEYLWKNIRYKLGEAFDV